MVPLQILKLFSLFISLWYDSSYKYEKPKIALDKEKYAHIISLFGKLKKHAEQYEFNNLSDMLEGVEYILNDMSFELRTNNITFSSNLTDIINKRNNIKYNVFRIVNSSGDNMEFLEIDYYSGHIIIEAKKRYYYDKKEEIANILRDNLSHKIISISIKHNINFEISSKPMGENFETIFGQSDFNSRIDCNELINIIVKPKNFPKTGFFIDNRKIRKYVSNYSQKKRILNLCSYTCTIGAIARINGAKSVINVDKEGVFLELGKDIYQRQTPSIEFKNEEFLTTDIRSFFTDINNENKFDLIILDLPEIAPIPSNFINNEKTYKDHNLQALKLLDKNGILITSCCSHGFSRKRFLNILKDITNNTKFQLLDGLRLDNLEDHPIKKGDIYSDYLKIYAIQNLE